ncbi:unnamed protein product [Toxocara canis]|nr:unnamed protein product [Toxocara canis]
MDGVPCEFRAVCRLWKSFWESTHHLKKAVARLRITADNDKYIVERWSSKSSKCIEVDRVCKAHLSIILSLIEITKVMCQGRCYYGSLWLGGEAANAEVLAAIASQKWHITKVRLFGDLGNLTADSLCEFFETINGANGGAEVRDLRIADFILADDCLCDRLVSAMHPKLSEFHILPSLTR